LAEPYRNTIFETIEEKLRSYNSGDKGHAGDKDTTGGLDEQVGKSSH
jgi:hypothetical protein